MNRLISISTYILALLWALPFFGIVYMAFKDASVQGYSLTFRNFIDAWNAAPFG
ncbi:carbohydrate ABC transporter permease, partial [Butyricicoccus sp. 1XD8-22]